MYKKIISVLIFLSIAYPASGDSFSLFSTIPFVGILLSIALIPLVNHHFWESHYGKVSLFWALSFLLPAAYFSFSNTAQSLVHTALLEYFPFIIILLALFTISGGIQINGSLVGTPKLNLGLILIGTGLASWIGTTGAAMLLIRPIIRANKKRKHKTHIIIFFIILVANIGGALTPLGDPPLFIGFLKGVDFFWTTKYLFFPMLIHVIFVGAIFYMVDSYFYKKEESEFIDISHENHPIKIQGKINLLLIVCVVFSVYMSGAFKFGVINIYGTEIPKEFLLRDCYLIMLTYLSWHLTKRELRKSNGFTWFPISEVAKLFAGIFVTIIPVLSILGKGEIRDLSNMMYFWLTGVLSAFLDNAPTYFVFFNTAGSGRPAEDIAPYLMEIQPMTLLAISSGAVFFGALTYIGNAPNFMVRSIAEENDIEMPSFFGYMVWSLAILVPIFTIYSIVVFYLLDGYL